MTPDEWHELKAWWSLAGDESEPESWSEGKTRRWFEVWAAERDWASEPKEGPDVPKEGPDVPKEGPREAYLAAVCFGLVMTEVLDSLPAHRSQLHGPIQTAQRLTADLQFTLHRRRAHSSFAEIAAEALQELACVSRTIADGHRADRARPGNTAASSQFRTAAADARAAASKLWLAIAEASGDGSGAVLDRLSRCQAEASEALMVVSPGLTLNEKYWPFYAHRAHEAEELGRGQLHELLLDRMVEQWRLDSSAFGKSTPGGRAAVELRAQARERDMSVSELKWEVAQRNLYLAGGRLWTPTHDILKRGIRLAEAELERAHRRRMRDQGKEAAPPSITPSVLDAIVATDSARRTIAELSAKASGRQREILEAMEGVVAAGADPVDVPRLGEEDSTQIRRRAADRLGMPNSTFRTHLERLRRKMPDGP